MKGKWQGRKIALLLTFTLLAGVTTAFAAEEAIQIALSGLYEQMMANKTTTALDKLELQVRENNKADSLKEAAKIFNTGVYEQGFDNTLTRDVVPLQAESSIASEKISQAKAPIDREAGLYKAIQSLVQLREQRKMDEKLLALTREEATAARTRYEAGILSATEWDDAEDAVTNALLDLEKRDLTIASASLEVKRLAGTDFDTELLVSETDAIAQLDTLFADSAKLPEWITSARKVDAAYFDKTETLRFLDMKLEIAKGFIPETHSRVIEMRRDREYARLALVDAQDGIEVAVRNLLNDRLTATEQVTLAKKELEMAKRRLSQANLKKDAGVFGRSDVIPNERAVLRAEFGVVSAVAALNAKEADLRALIGEGVLP